MDNKYITIIDTKNNEITTSKLYTLEEAMVIMEEMMDNDISGD